MLNFLKKIVSPPSPATEPVAAPPAPAPVDPYMLGLRDAVLSGWFNQETDELFSGKVGQQQRTGDDYARQAAACEKITLSGVELLVAGLPCGNDCNEDCEQQERDSCPCE